MTTRSLRWFTDLSIQGRITLLVSVSTFFFLLFFLFSAIVSERGLSNLDRAGSTALPMVAQLHQVEMQFLRLRDAFNEAIADQDADALGDATALATAIRHDLQVIAAQEPRATGALLAFNAYVDQAGTTGTAAVNGSLPMDRLYAAISAGKAREDNFRMQFSAFRLAYLGQVKGWVEQARRDSLYLRTVGIALGLLALASMLLLGWWIVRSVRDGLQAAVTVAESIADGQWDVPVDLGRRDETGHLLGAIHRMRATLLERQAADHRREARTTILVELGERMRGQLSPEQLCDNVLGYLVEVAHAAVGVLYTFDKDTRHLMPAATWATSAAPVPLRLGEGLAGQVAAERRLLRIDHLPQGYLTVSSGLVAVRPQQLLLLPLLHNDELVGVLELGMVEHCDETRVALLQECLRSVAVGLVASMAYALLRGPQQVPATAGR